MDNKTKPFIFLAAFFTILFMLFPMLFLDIPFGSGMKGIIFSTAFAIVGGLLVIALPYFFKGLSDVSWKSVSIICLISISVYFGLALLFKQTNNENVSETVDFYEKLKGSWKSQVDSDAVVILKFISNELLTVNVETVDEDTANYDYSVFECNYSFLNEKEIYAVDSTGEYELNIKIVNDSTIIVEEEEGNVTFKKESPAIR
ncbi:hypothetical protein V9L05_09125 [Bernardetia sp. Wsw4-3y2]|uniref:hypothetical protein n=1 Tax=Bernardetia sp. Wsw4-3y2 TaxID=3127471 RepID=UPI0030D4B33C